MKRFSRYKWIGVPLMLWLLFCSGCGREMAYELQSTEQEFETEEAAAEAERVEKETEDPETICVYICGEVANPGVYELDTGSRVLHAVEAAGGLTEKACARSLNQARLLADGEQITVLNEEEAAAGAASAEQGRSDAGGEQQEKVNINTAELSQLTALTGIGETKAQAILRFRREQGPFQSIEDLKQVDGIAEKTFEKIKDRITVS